MNAHSLTPLHGNPATTVPLKVMATTDLHMHMLGYDYFADRPTRRFGLSRVAHLIEAERGEAPNCLLFDNGDFLQGNPLGDFLAQAPAPRGPHPAIAAMNALGYDAATLGNHDFSFGLSYLRRVLGGARFPFVSTNLRSRAGLNCARTLVLDREVRDRAGGRHPLRLGVLGFLPPQTVAWEPELRGEVWIDDIVETAREGIARLRAQGAHLILALSHSGIGPLEPRPMMENAATALAALPGIDLVICGHTHRVFPAPDHPQGPGIDIASGTLAGKPAVMPGFWGSHLGVIELELIPGPTPGADWRIATFRSRCEPVADLPEHVQVAAPALAAHRQALKHFRHRVGRTQQPLSSHFALIGQDAGLRLVAMAQRWHLRRALARGPWRNLPILSAAAPFRAGGRGGPDHYTDVPEGRLTLASLADLYLFPNRLCAVLMTGARLADWLERSASLFHRIQPGARDQELTDPEFPSYSFDLIDGLQWQLDLSRPARHAPDGRLLDPQARRVTDLRHAGLPVRPDQPFILATNSYRLSDCGFFAPSLRGQPVILSGGPRTRDVIRRYVARNRLVAPRAGMGWCFRPMPETTVLFHTSPMARPRLDGLPLRAEDLGEGPDGFMTLRLRLD
ncbi:MAG: bifunctional 2',3'-cyclic-nucleotide 2'-phosphodiesterase/3'-nucleotidase [Paracoccus sp. (in: a-proteobacteria)]|uniref:bifunctional 2',3'-cyclic-nucleotide 2'-phosphodiesterase/3'-nucleotidase n=1 Tax=Paracoccus sp. TaxID=267 RepID=UPI0039E6127C